MKTSEHSRTKSQHGSTVRGLLRPLAGATLIAVAQASVAGQFATDDPDLQIRWDNTLRYNLGVRVEQIDPEIRDSVDGPKSDTKFGRGDINSNRIDVLSEFDVQYKRSTGVRVSAAAWYDQAYHDTTGYTNFIKRYNAGPYGEVLDAFAFTSMDIGDMSASFKAGRHNIFWGEAFFTNANSVAYSQGPLDIRKALANPGIEIKELFLPLNQISSQLRMTDELTFAGQYFLQWQPSRLPDGGTYFGSGDFATQGGGTMALPWVSFSGIGTHPKDRGDWGLAAFWSPQALDGKLGFYVRRFGEKLPWLTATAPIFTPTLAPNPTDAQFSYASDTRLYGVSLGKNMGGFALGAELSYRENTALYSSAFAPTTEGARGNTWHGLVNGLWLLGKAGPVWDSAVLIAELSFSHLDKVTKNAAFYRGVGTAACTGASQLPDSGDKFDDCTTRTGVGISLNFQPKWFQVAPGVDLTAPMSYSVGVWGNDPGLGGNRQGSGSWSAGLSADINTVYQVSLTYSDYLNRDRTNGTSAVTTANSLSTLYNDRGWLALTFKTAF